MSVLLVNTTPIDPPLGPRMVHSTIPAAAMARAAAWVAGRAAACATRVAPPAARPAEAWAFARVWYASVCAHHRRNITMVFATVSRPWRADSSGFWPGPSVSPTGLSRCSSSHSASPGQRKTKKTSHNSQARTHHRQPLLGYDIFKQSAVALCQKTRGGVRCPLSMERGHHPPPPADVTTRLPGSGLAGALWIDMPRMATL